MAAPATKSDSELRREALKESSDVIERGRKEREANYRKTDRFAKTVKRGR